MSIEPESAPAAAPPPSPSPRDRRRFRAAVALFLAWIAFLIGLAATDAYRPQERAGAAPADARVPADGRRHAGAPANPA
ncbi:hypothetical protein [Paludisphaera sp.]|uniref:hypothetical protein n=1 Tax=Paludisphaera sp. TaxID=2017432 RepID=UPI00301C7C19